MTQRSNANASGGIRRGPRRADHFTITSNAVVNDERLSFRARGVLIWLLSKPADWRTRSEAIAEQSPREGREAIRTAMRELESLGYLVREKVQNERGQWSTIQTVYEEPVEPGDPSPEPGPRKPGRGDADNGDPGALTKDRAQRTETNNNHGPATDAHVEHVETASSLLGKIEEKAREIRSEDDRRLAELETATLAAGLPASYSRIRSEQRKAILESIRSHGIERLVDAAKRAHRPDNPTMHVHGYVRLWQALPAPRPSVAAPKCSECEGTGFVLNDDDLAVRCACRSTGRSAA
ncbi:replication protein [Rhodococcus sp. PD04]|uniref:replication protein n=1 Tax=Rhodococcus sp. PD04 TaxID=3109594 RepID=UPI002DD7EFF2|nr:replication protein [Rhodococcus sp. PD04]WSE22310.1 replication protein [Rhodococcus sp. PD04]